MKRMMVLGFCLSLSFGCARSTTVEGLEEGAACVEDADCAGDMKCINGLCTVVLDCATDDDCAATESCQNGFCVGRGACADASECAEDETCVNGVCTRMGSCTDDSECPPEASCVDGVCRQNGACASDADCSPDQTCGESGLCERNAPCDGDDDCPRDQSCIDDVCTWNDVCTTDADCPETQSCGPDGVCVRNDTCVGDDDCPIDQHCEAGLCARNDPCLDHSECPPDQACLSGTCVRSDCREDLDCDDGLFCNGAETCQIPDCRGGTAPVLDDGVACTVDTCDEVNDEVDNEVDHAECDDDNICTDDSCDQSAGCINRPNDTNVPPVVDGDCRDALCQNGFVVYTPDDSDLPVDDGIACTSYTCDAGALTSEFDHAACADTNPCTEDLCTATGCDNNDNNSLIPPQLANDDCWQEVCSAGDIVSVEYDGETPPQDATDDCYQQLCSNGSVVDAPADSEVPPQASTTDCRTDVCNNGLSWTANNSEVPPSDSVGCTVEVCSAGDAVHRPDDTLCDDQQFCNGAETCDAQLDCQAGSAPSCTNPNPTCYTAACDPNEPDGAGGAGKCMTALIDLDDDGYPKDGCGGSPANFDCVDDPGVNANAEFINPGADEVINGDDDDCDGYTDEGFAQITSCGGGTGGSHTPSTPAVFNDVTVTMAVTDPAGDGQYQLEWSVVQEPAANSLALSGAITNAVSFRPVLFGDYTMRLTLSQPGVADQTCDHALNVPEPPGINATLIMQEAVDVDLHVLRPDAGTLDWGWWWDDGFWGDYLNGDPTYDCHYMNCKMCSVEVPGQGDCVQNGPLNWDTDNADGDATLDVDNLRGCYDDALGNRVCTPESISIRKPFVENSFYGYSVAVHYYGASHDGPEPASVNVIVRLHCEGQNPQEWMCQGLQPDQWCFVRDVRWNGGACVGFFAPSSVPDDIYMAAWEKMAATPR